MHPFNQNVYVIKTRNSIDMNMHMSIYAANEGRYYCNRKSALVFNSANVQ